MLYVPITFFCQYCTSIIYTNIHYDIYINETVFPYSLCYSGYNAILTNECITLRNKTWIISAVSRAESTANVTTDRPLT
jgi:hypothetical protein